MNTTNISHKVDKYLKKIKLEKNKDKILYYKSKIDFYNKNQKTSQSGGFPISVRDDTGPDPCAQIMVSLRELQEELAQERRCEITGNPRQVHDDIIRRIEILKTNLYNINDIIAGLHARACTPVDIGNILDDIHIPCSNEGDIPTADTFLGIAGLSGPPVGPSGPPSGPSSAAAGTNSYRPLGPSDFSGQSSLIYRNEAFGKNFVKNTSPINIMKYLDTQRDHVNKNDYVKIQNEAEKIYTAIHNGDTQGEHNARVQLNGLLSSIPFTYT